jgi:galacturan 1,4-alpha-galacturonidase
VASLAQTFDVTKFGAVGDGSTDSTKGVQAAFDAAKGTSGSSFVTVLFPKGSYVFGPVRFEKLNNAVIEFADGAEMATLQDAEKWGKDGDDYIPWIQGSSCTGLTIRGGVFEGHNSYWDFTKNPKQDNPRPFMMQFTDMNNFKAHDMKLQNAPHTHFKVGGGETVEIFNMHLQTKMNTANTDGIMLANVNNGHVHNVSIQNGDDCMKANDNSKNIVFENGTCIGGHGLSIGGGSSSLDIQNVTFRDIDLIDMSYGARIKFTKKTTGSLSGVTYEKLRMKHVKRPLYITTGYESMEATLSSTTMSMRFNVGDINYIGITAEDGEGMGGSGSNIVSPGDFECDSTAPCTNIHLRNVDISTKAKWTGSEFGGDASSDVTPDASSKFKPATQTTWSKHMGRNCYGGHGATNIDTDPVGKLTLADCEKSCDESAGCTGITIKWSLNGEPTDCWRRSNINIAACDSGNGYDTWTKTLTAMPPSQIPASIDSTSWHKAGEQEILVV